MQAQDLAVLAVETLLPSDTLPIHPQASAAVNLEGNRLELTPELSGEETEKTKDYTVEIRSMPLRGTPGFERAPFRSPGESTEITLAPETAYAYRLIYRNFADGESKSPWKEVGNLEVSSLEIPHKPEPQNAWMKYLIGFPYAAAFKEAVSPAFDNNAPVTLKSASGSVWQTLTIKNGLGFQRGKGYLLGIGEAFSPALPQKLPLHLETVSIDLADTGWHTISNPFLFPLSAENVETIGGDRSSFLSLQVVGGPKDDNPYVWEAADTLMPFQGYAVYAEAPTRLVFHPPGFETTPAPVAKVGESENAKWRIVIRKGDGVHHLKFFSGRAGRRTPFLAPPAGKLHAWIQSDVALSEKPVAGFDALDETLIITDSRGGNFAVEILGLQTSRSHASPGPGTDLTVLIDMRSGKIHREDQMTNIPMESGTGSYRLLSGSPAFVENGIRSFTQSFAAKTALLEIRMLSQPGRFRVSYVLPSGGGKIIGSRLDIYRLDGGKVQSIELPAREPGPQTFESDSKIRVSGKHYARLWVDTDGGRFSASMGF